MKKMSAKKQSQVVKAILPTEIYKVFKKKVEEQGFTQSQWIRHQITKYTK